MPEETEHKGQGSLVRSMGRNAFGVMVSRLSGVLRAAVYAGFWGGSGVAQAAYTWAFQYPNMFRALFGEGAFSSAMVPAVSEKLVAGDREGAWRVAERTISLQIVVLCVLVLVMSLLSLAGRYCVPEGVFQPYIRLACQILPILLPYMVLVCATASFASILNALKVYALPALNQAVFNIVQVVAIVFISFRWNNTEWPALLWFSISVLVAGVLQVMMLYMACRQRGFVYHFRPVWRDSEVQKVCKRFIPSLIGSGTGLVNQFIDGALVSRLLPISVSALANSHLLIYLPVGMLGVTMGNACLTDMSRCAAAKDMDGMADRLDFSLRFVLFTALPCMMFMFVLAEPIATLLFRHGCFDENSLQRCVGAFCFYLPALPVFCCLKVATPPFHACMDTRTPMAVGVWCIVLNLVLNLCLIGVLKERGLALATTISHWVQILVLLILVKRKCLPQWQWQKTVRGGLMMLLASAISCGLAYVTLGVLPDVGMYCPLMGAKMNAVLRLACGGVLGGGFYLLLCRIMKRPELDGLLAVVRRRGQVSRG